MKQFIRRGLLAFCVALCAIVSTTSISFAQNLIPDSTFEDGSIGAWWASANLDAEVRDGQFCVTTRDNGGANASDSIFGYGNLNLEANRLHDFHFDLSAPDEMTVSVIVQMDVEPWTEYYGLDLVGIGEVIHYESPYVHTVPDPQGQLTFQFGGQGAGTVCVDNVVLGPPSAPPVATEAVHVDQLGYFTNSPKIATVASADTSPLVWTVVDGNGLTALQGTTTVYGQDTSSGLHLHQIDFSQFSFSGDGNIIQVGALSSHPFAVSDNPYDGLLYDAFRYYYFARSTDPLELPYVDNGQWVRPAGPTDDQVACWPGSGCTYTLDVSKGWYDAGDYGKYVVNSGFTVWQLLNLYERGIHIDPDSLAPFADGRMNIPESGNGVSDLLDEVRYNLEFMLGMQVPDSEPLAGMVHHKMHNTEWHALGMSPFDLGANPRYLTPPTTIATLYFAGATAQCARVWATIDAAFSQRCLNAAEKAWTAASANPDVTHPDVPYNNGGGPYSNLAFGDAIADEFYWAAAELFISTGRNVYRDSLLASTPNLAPAQAPLSAYETSMSGRMSLSMVPNGLAQSDLDAVKTTIIELADTYVGTVNSTGFGVPIPEDFYYWGSNTLLLNHVMVLGVAYDLTGNNTYHDAAREAVNYIFGRNPLGQSYVTGYGEQAASFPTSTWYANVINPARPPIPSGFLAGGPNIIPGDAFAAEALDGCVGATCYLDHIRSYSTNEIAINVNSALVWAIGFVESDVTPMADIEGDVNCDETVAAIDALFILQYTVGLRNDSGGCPLPDNGSLHATMGDVNNDQTLSPIDALFILQCVVNINNPFCPAAVPGRQVVSQGVSAAALPTTVDVEAIDSGIRLHASAPIAAGTFEVSYEEKVSTFIGCANSGLAMAVCHEVRPGVVRIGYVDAQGANGSGMLVELNFSGAIDETADQVVLTTIEVTDDNGNPLPVGDRGQNSLSLYLPLFDW